MARSGRPATDAVGIGQVYLGKYRVEEILGHGGMGIVARCTHLVLGEQVAIKMLRQDVLLDPDATARFMREAQAAVRLRSEYVAHVYDVGLLDDSVPYMVMEFLDGQDLGEILEEQRTVNAQWAVELMLQAAEALAEAHSLNIVHRDVKPTNLFVTWRPDNTSLLKVLDFGISKSPVGTDMQLTQTQSLLGTPAYMSPEQMRSARLVDARSDVWSLGTVMYELVEGRRPFEAESFSEMCVKVAVDDPRPMENAPPALEAVVLRCLAKSPDERYPNMAELGRDLIPFARDPHQAQMLVDRMFRMLGREAVGGWDGATPGSGIEAFRTPIPGRERARTPLPAAAKSVAVAMSSRRRVGLAVGIVAAAIALGGGLALVYFDREPAPAAATMPPPAGPPPAGDVAGSAVTVDTPRPAVDPAAGVTAIEPADEAKPTDEVKPAAIEPPVASRKPKPKPKPKPKLDKPVRQVETKVEPPPAPPPVEPVKPKPTREDIYSKPRPDRR